MESKLTKDQKKKLLKLFQRMQEKEFRIEITLSDRYLKMIKRVLGRTEK